MLSGACDEGGLHPGPCSSRHVPPVSGDDQALGNIGFDLARSRNFGLMIRMEIDCGSDKARRQMRNSLFKHEAGFRRTNPARKLPIHM